MKTPVIIHVDADLRDEKDAPGVVVIRRLDDRACEVCSKVEECRPYGAVKNGARLWVCFDCAMKDKAEATKAFDERLDGKVLI